VYDPESAQESHWILCIYPESFFFKSGQKNPCGAGCSGDLIDIINTGYHIYLHGIGSVEPALTPITIFWRASGKDFEFTFL